MRLPGLKRLIAVLVLLALVAGAVLYLVGEARGSGPLRFQLSSGTEVRVLGASYGTRHNIPGWWRRLPSPLRSLVSRLLGRNLLGPAVLTTPSPTLVVWLQHNATNTLGWPQQVKFMLADETGELGGDSAYFTVFAAISGPNSVSFTALPRRSPNLTLVALEQTPSGKHRRVAEVVLRNPAQGTFPEWAAEPLPQSQTNAGLVCTLKSLKTGFGSATSQSYEADGQVRVQHSRADEDGRSHAEIAVQFLDPQTPSNLWEVVAIHVADASGNHVSNGTLSSSRIAEARSSNPLFPELWAGERQQFTFAPALWPSEPWRLELLAGRAAGSQFAPAELAVFTNIALPEIGTTSRVDQAIRVGATTVTLESLLRREPFPEYVMRWNREELSEIGLSIAGLPVGMRFTLVSATDDAGRTLETPSWSWDHSEPERVGYGISRIHREARSVNLVIAVHPLRRFSFQVRAAPGAESDFLPPTP